MSDPIGLIHDGDEATCPTCQNIRRPHNWIDLVHDATWEDET